MANPLYGFSLYKAPTNEANEEYPLIVANSQTITVGDPVIISGGFAMVPTAGAYAITSNPIIGIACKTVTATSTNQTVAKVTVPVVTTDQRYTFLAGADGELSTTTHAGMFFSLSTVGPSGQFLGVNAASVSYKPISSTSVLCIGVDPQQEGTTGSGGGSRKGLFRFVNTADQPLYTPTTYTLT